MTNCRLPRSIRIMMILHVMCRKGNDRFSRHFSLVSDTYFLCCFSQGTYEYLSTACGHFLSSNRSKAIYSCLKWYVNIKYLETIVFSSSMVSAFIFIT